MPFDQLTSAAQASAVQERRHEEAADAEYELKECPVDGIRRRNHPKCEECFILVGPGHLEWEFGDGSLCGSCTDFVRRYRSDNKVA
jgi:hypothetical protein